MSDKQQKELNLPKEIMDMIEELRMYVALSKTAIKKQDKVKMLLGSTLESIDMLQDMFIMYEKRNRKRKTKDYSDIVGQKFGRLEVLSHVSPIQQYEVICECGTIKKVRRGNLLHGQSKSCGCMRNGKYIKHGYPITNRTYSIWQNIKKRCSYPRHESYSYYGARGIRVCDRWHDFNNFLEDMGDCPDGCELHRIDHNGNYEPGNCEWKNIFKHRSEHHKKEDK